jgi:hypothetical protein
VENGLLELRIKTLDASEFIVKVEETGNVADLKDKVF